MLSVNEEYSQIMFPNVLRTVVSAAIRIIKESESMAWTTPTLVEICIGLEINGYLPAGF
jgi:coenzyme PQQ precursor peptide PqqA